MQTLMERVNYAKALWAMTFEAHIRTRRLEMPDDSFFVRVASKFTVEEYEYAIGRTAHKFPFKQPARPPYITMDELIRYTGGILNNERAAKDAQFAPMEATQ